jgi:hypothetical protein
VTDKRMRRMLWVGIAIVLLAIAAIFVSQRGSFESVSAVEITPERGNR